MSKIHKTQKPDNEYTNIVIVVKRGDKKQEVKMTFPQDLLYVCDLNRGLGMAPLDDVSMTFFEPGMIDVLIEMLKSIKKEGC